MKQQNDDYQEIATRIYFREDLLEAELGYIERIIALEGALKDCITIIKELRPHGILESAADAAERVLYHTRTPKPASAGSVTGD